MLAVYITQREEITTIEYQIMKVEELIKALQERPQDAEVFYLTEDSGMYQVNTVKSAAVTHDEVKKITGEEFVVLT